jgi:hypothetical protein
MPITVAVMPGDWRDQVRQYAAWVRRWYEPLAPRKQWYRRLWSFVSYGPYHPKTAPIDERLDFLALARLRNAKVRGSADYIHLFGWAITDRFGHWGAYDHYQDLGGVENFRKSVSRAQQAGQPIGLYLDGYLVAKASDKPNRQQVEDWAIRRPDGQKLYHKEYDAHSMCPYLPAWREYLARFVPAACTWTNTGGVFPRGPATAKSTATHRPRECLPANGCFRVRCGGQFQRKLRCIANSCPPILRRSSLTAPMVTLPWTTTAKAGAGWRPTS